jgi:hypothetical protein
MRRFTWIFVGGCLIAAYVAVSMYNKPHKDYASEEVAKSWAADELVAWYTSHPAEHHAQWQEKVIAVTGEVTSADSRGVILAPAWLCPGNRERHLNKPQQDRFPSKDAWWGSTICLARSGWITLDSRPEILHDFLTYAKAQDSLWGVNFEPCLLP